MTEEELERLMESFNTQIQGTGAAGALGTTMNIREQELKELLKYYPDIPLPGQETDASTVSNIEMLLGGYSYVDAKGNSMSYMDRIKDLYGDQKARLIRDSYEDMDWWEKAFFEKQFKFAQDAPGEAWDLIVDLFGPTGLGAINLSEAEEYQKFFPPPVELPKKDEVHTKPTNVRGNPITVLPEHPGYPEPSPGNPHKDKPVDFNLFDWLNEHLPPPGPAPEPPEMYKPPHWTEGLGEKNERGFYKENVHGPQNWRRDGVQQIGNLDYYNLTQDLIGEGSIAPYTLPDWAELRDHPGNPHLGWTYGPGVTESMVSDHYNDWARSNAPAIHADQEKQYQQAVDENQRRYDEMVAEMVETERLRQEEYAAERQRLTEVASTPGFNEYSYPWGQFPSDQTYSTDMTRHPPLQDQLLDLPEWGSNTKSYDDTMTALLNFMGAEELQDYLYRLRSDVGQPIIPVDPIDPPISQEEIILNQTRPGGGIGLSEQIINQSKPGTYLYPGMLN